MTPTETPWEAKPSPIPASVNWLNFPGEGRQITNQNLVKVKGPPLKNHIRS